MCCKNVIDFYLFIYSKLSSNTFAGCYYSTKLSTVLFLKTLGISLVRITKTIKITTQKTKLYSYATHTKMSLHNMNNNYCNYVYMQS